MQTDEQGLIIRRFEAPNAELLREDVQKLADAIRNATKVAVLTGAGCSTESGIPDYRSPNGTWTKHKPIYYADFTRNAYNRQRYWARSLSGWRQFAAAHPNQTHYAIANLERLGKVNTLITQNVDGLHQQAGSHHVIELHGNNDMVVCLSCRSNFSRTWLQLALVDLNPGWTARIVELTPDGDAALDREDFSNFKVPDCPACGGVLKPDVVFFGESVPLTRVDFCNTAIDEADALLVAGSSLTVWSGYRFVRRAAQQNKPILIANIGPTRADDLATVKVQARLGDLLSAVVAELA